MDIAIEVDKRKHERFNVLCAVLVAPNGHSHEGYILDVSAGGARVDLVPGWTPSDGSAMRMFFDMPDADSITLQSHVAWVAVDHMGLRFDTGQDDEIGRLMEAAGAAQ